MRSKLFGLGHNLFGGHVKGRARNGGGARATGPFAEENHIGVALQVLHVGGIKTEAVADELLKDGLVPLPLRHTAREERHRSRAIEADFSALITGRRRTLDCVGKADAAQPSATARLSSAKFETIEIGEFQRQVHILLELA